MFDCEKVLKQDAFGSIEKGFFYTNVGAPKILAIRRVYAAHPLWGRIGRFLANNEKRALKKLQYAAKSTNFFPELLHEDEHGHIRAYIEGSSLHHCPRPIPAHYFTDCKKLLKIMRSCGVANNDLAKEANWLITENDQPAITDFQLAMCFKSQSGRFALITAREDLRHLLKHKRTYDKLTPIEDKIVKRKSYLSRIWQHTGKKVYLFVTRKILKWKERTGPEERDF